MKTKPHLVVLLAAGALTCATASAQQPEKRPGAPADAPAGAPATPPPAPSRTERASGQPLGPGAERPRFPAPERGAPGEPRREGDRPGAGPREGGRPHAGPPREGDFPRGERPPGQARDGDRPPGGPRDGDRPPGPRREGDRPTPAPRDGDRHGPGSREGDRPGGGSREGDRPASAPRDGEHRGGGPRDGAPPPPMPPPQPQPFLGVMSMPLPEPLAAQLSIPAGFGLIVAEVLPGSPAASAGIQKFDVLKQLNDQQLVSPDQLAALVRAAGKDQEVSLTIVRKAQEQKLTVKVGERMMPSRPPFPGANPQQMQEMQEMMRHRAREYQERTRDRMEQFRKQHGDHGRPRAEIAPEEILREARPGGSPQIKVLTESGVTTMAAAKARMLLKDDSGEIEVAGENGKRTLTARDPEGKVLFTGPVDTPEQLAAVPPAFREKLDNIRVRTQSGEQGERPSPFQARAEEQEQAPVLDVQ
jgi:hypothetical protein